ncbi:MAG TPA: Gfo/Idh/MocA family oxidoreductase [Draconibacterium sp.]|nr:Gfo/Idh/MocA family oxidoreductase [Draconibacterium sp.]
MTSRRDFIKKTGKGVAFTTMAASGILAEPVLAAAAEKQKIIGIIGAENSHTAGYGRLFNVEKKFPGWEVKYVWGETDEFAKNAMEKGNIPVQVNEQKEMMGKIDALIVDHRHPKYHLKAAWPFVEAGIPTFVDKPFCYRASEGKDFLQMAKEKGTPVSSYSSLAQSLGTFDMIDQLQSMDKISQVVRTGTADLDSKYGGIFFYGVHIVQPLMYMFGEDIEEVRVNRNGNTGNASLKYSSGLFATLIFKNKAYGWETYVESGNKFVELKSRVEESEPGKNYVDMVEMFSTGKEPRSYQSILNCVSVLESLEKSAETEKWTAVEYVKL